MTNFISVGLTKRFRKKGEQDNVLYIVSFWADAVMVEEIMEYIPMAARAIRFYLEV